MLKPLGDKVFVELLPPRAEENGLVMVAKKHHFDYVIREGKVLAAGVKNHEVIPGDHVIFHGHAGKWVDQPGSQRQPLFRVLKANEVIGIYAPY